MSKIVDTIKGIESEYIGSVSMEVIEEAQRELNFQFPEEYKEILKNFGVISIGSHEIFGLGVENYLNVIVATKSERNRYPNLLEKYIVIENFSMEGILILLNNDGEVYEFYNGKIKLITESLVQYLTEEIISKL